MRPTPRQADTRSALSTVELLVAVAILGLVAVALSSVLTVALKEASRGSALAGEAQFAFNRIAQLAEETSVIVTPAVGATSTVLTIREQALDNYRNGSTTFATEGDGLLDADLDGDRIVGNSLLEPITPVTFSISSGTLRESWVDYGLNVIDEPLCSNVIAFTAARERTNLVLLTLTMQQGDDEITLVTRLRARNMGP